MHRAHRCTLADTVWAPTSANRTPSLRRRPLPGRPPCRPPSLPRAAARPTRPTIPCAPRPRIRPTARRHPRPLSRCVGPGPWLARIAPHASLFRRMREKGPLPGNFRPKCMFFEIKMATSSPHASISGRNRAIQDTWRANLAAKGPFSRRGARNHAWREDVASAARPFRGSGMRSGGTGLAPCGSGMRSGRTGFAPCGAGLACLPHAPPPAISLVPAAACAPCHLACACRRPRSSPPSYTRRASPPASRPPCAAIRRTAHCGRGEPSIRLFLLPSCCPRRANRTPAPRQPSPAHPWSRLRPSAPRHPLHLALPRGSRCGSGNSCEMVR